MEELLVGIKKRIDSGQFQSEAAVREAIVLPILQALGWDIFDPRSVLREYSLGNRRVDYALSSSPPRREIFVEVKSVGQSLGADRQLFEYAFHEGIPFAILTDGREWNFFLPAEQGSYDERRVQKLDLAERSEADAAAIFHKYLELSRVRSGDALASARDDYKNISRRKVAAEKITTAWSDLISERDEFLIDLLAEKTEAICGYRPAPEDVEAFLISFSRGGGTQVAAADAKRRARPAPTVLAATSERHVHYTILGQSKKADSAIDALIDILRTLAAQSPDFLKNLSQVVPGRTRNHIADTRENVYPRKPELLEYSFELVPGWWLGTNIANRDKMRIIEKACQVEGLVLGKDIQITLPNAE